MVIEIQVFDGRGTSPAFGKKMKRLLLMTSLALLAGCAAFEPLPRDAASAKVEISAFIPEGTPLDEAKARLEKKGLKCRVRDDVDAARTLYLFGSADSLAMPMVRRVWLVRFEVKNGRVYAPYVGIDLTGP